MRRITGWWRRRWKRSGARPPTEPLRLIGSYDNLLYGTLFYFPEKPSTLEIMNPLLTPWTDAARVDARRHRAVLSGSR